MPLIILKLGGSIISFKNGNKPRFRKMVVKRLVEELVEAKSKNTFQLMIIHGTGSFGHPPAHRYKLQKGINHDPTNMGLSISKRQGFLLNNFLWKVLEEYSIPAITIAPFSIIESSNGKIKKADITKIKDLLKIDRVPLLFGDEVLDIKQGYSICSSDQIAVFLASKLKPALLLFATDVDGVYQDDPKNNSSAQHFKTLHLNSIKDINKTMLQNYEFDVSGEMKGKLSFLLGFPIDKKTTIRIFNGLIPKRLYKALSGKAIGTTILQ